MNSSIKKNLTRQLIINSLILVVAFVIFRGVTYSLDSDTTNDNKDLLIQTGNMQVVLNTPNEKYEFLDTLKSSVSDEVGKKQEGYNFSITNTGNIPIEYYEIRLVDEENKISSLPHKYLRFIINKDKKEYSNVQNLGDVDSIIYFGYNLGVGESSSFNLRMWLSDDIKNIYDKELYLAMEVTLYQKYDVYDNYILYEGDGGRNVPVRTSIYSPISTVTPIKDGYMFLGWSTSINGNVKYTMGDAYSEKKGQTLYAVWKKISD